MLWSVPAAARAVGGMGTRSNAHCDRNPKYQVSRAYPLITRHDIHGDARRRDWTNVQQAVREVCTRPPRPDLDRETAIPGLTRRRRASLRSQRGPPLVSTRGPFLGKHALFHPAPRCRVLRHPFPARLRRRTRDHRAGRLCALRSRIHLEPPARRRRGPCLHQSRPDQSPDARRSDERRPVEHDVLRHAGAPGRGHHAGCAGRAESSVAYASSADSPLVRGAEPG